MNVNTMGMLRSFPARLILFGILLCLLHCAGNNILPLVDRDEPRFAEATREMLQRGNWIIPYFNGDYRFDKPPLIYWMQAASCSIFGLNEFGVRFPSAVCAALTAVVLILWGRRWIGEAAGWRAGILFGICAQMVMHGRASVADMPMVLAVAATGWFAFLAGQGARRAYWGFWLSLAAGFLAKGPVAWLPLLAMPFAAPQARTVLLGRVRWIGGIFLMLGPVAAWGVPALLMTHGEFWNVGMGKHVINRSVGVMEGHGVKGLLGYLGSLPLYLLTVWVSFFPGSIWLPRALRTWKSAAREDVNVRFVIALIAVFFAVFTLVRTKLPHYTLPAFPFLAMWVASLWRPGVGVETAAAKSPSAGAFQKWAIGWTVFLAIAPFVAFPYLANHAPSEDLWRKIGEKIAPETAIATVDYQEPSLIWTLRRKVTGFLDVIGGKRAERWLSEKGPRLLVCTAATFKERFVQTPPGVEVISFGGFNIADGKHFDLIALWKK